MTIPEAVQLVLQASVLGHGGEIFVLDMGEPVRILDLATDLIKLSGLEPGRDIKIVYTDIQPGEKLNEELFLAREQSQVTPCPRILAAVSESTIESALVEQVVVELINLTREMDSQNAVDEMQILLPQVCNLIDNYLPVPKPMLPEATVTLETPAIKPLLVQPSLPAS
jgi:FlaA1/EpsC-like NDP-sugar epimerase